MLSDETKKALYDCGLYDREDAEEEVEVVPSLFFTHIYDTNSYRSNIWIKNPRNYRFNYNYSKSLIKYFKPTFDFNRALAAS